MQHLVTIHENKAKTTSKLIAGAFGKSHKHVIRDIKNLDCSESFHKLNFEVIEVEVKLGLGKTRKDLSYSITRDGFTFLAMGYTGAKAAKFKEEYIKAFNEMEEKLNGPQNTQLMNVLQELHNKVNVLSETVAELKSKQVQIEQPKELAISSEPLSLFTVAQYIYNNDEDIPSGYLNVISRIASSYSISQGLEVDKNHPKRYCIEALSYAVKEGNRIYNQQRKRATEILSVNPMALSLKVLLVGEYTIFPDNGSVNDIVNLFNKYTVLNFKAELRRTTKFHYKVTRIL